MAELRIYFADLIAFVKNADGSYWVLLPDARLPSTASDGRPIEAHHPVALFELPATPTSDWPRIHQLLKLQDPPTSNEAWLLDRQELRLVVSPNLPVQAPGTASTGLPASNNRTDFTWVPDLAAMGLDAKVEPGCLLPAPLPPPAPPPAGPLPSSRIVSRLRLENGTLTTFQFVKQPDASLPPRLRIPKLELKALGSSTTHGGERACADVVVATVPLAGPTVTVQAVNLDNGALERSITLTSSTPVINLVLGNLSPDPPPGPLPREGLHFERYYDLLQAVPAQRPIPHLVSGFPADPSTHVSPLGLNGDLPLFVITALQVKFSGFNGPICSVVTLQS